MVQYDDFIPQNTAPVGVKRIGVYNSSNKRVGIVKLGGLAKQKGEKLYSFGAISDIHLSVADSETDFIRAMGWLNDRADFLCICGDLTNNGSDTQLARYRELVDAHAKIPVYAVTGNHDTYTHNDAIETNISPYTGKALYYTFTMGNDVFIMLGIKSEGALFTEAERQFLRETLNANRNKRCFLFQHCFPGYGNAEECGNANGIYFSYCWSGDGQEQLEELETLLANYRNTLFLHGHSHLKFRLQDSCDYANIDESKGYRSIHIPSVSRPRQEDGADEDTSPDYDDAGSEGYLVDVYENGIHLRGFDFARGSYVPMASYWIDTTLQTVDPMFRNWVKYSTDTDGSIFNGTGFKENVRLSSSGGISGSAQNGAVTTGFIPWYGDTTVLRMKGVEWLNATANYGGHYYIMFYDANKKIRGTNDYTASINVSEISHILTVTRDENGVETFVFNKDYGTTNSFLQWVRSASFIRITARGKGADMIVTVNEEIL